jgi:hypothetical protein
MGKTILNNVHTFIRRGRDRMVVGFTTYAIRARCITLRDKVC